MRITPQRTIDEYLSKHPEQKNVPGNLVHYAVRFSEPGILAYAPDVNVEQTVFREQNLAAQILYQNLRKLLRQPTGGPVDLKQKFCSVYTTKTNMKPFFSGKGFSLLTFRLAMEVTLLYGMTAEDLQTMTWYPCEFEPSENEPVPNADDLRNIPTKKDVARYIEKIWNQKRDVTLSVRLLKGMVYPSYGDALCTFRALGADPYQAVVAFATKDTNWMDFCRVSPSNEKFLTLSTLPVNPVATTGCDAAQTISSEPATVSVETPDVPASLESKAGEAEPISTEEPEAPAPVTGRTDSTPEANPADGGTEAETATNNEEPLPETTKRLPFGQIIQEALLPVSSKRAVYLPRNIYTLREGYQSHRGSYDRVMDNLFVDSNPTNLDIFNLLVRTSRVYCVPMDVLFFSEIPYEAFPPSATFSMKTFSMDDVRDALGNLGKDKVLTDKTLFTVLSDLIKTYGPKMVLNRFGYDKKKSASTLAPTMAKGIPSAAPAKRSNPTTAPVQAEENHDTKEEVAVMSNKPTATSAPANLSLKLRVCMSCDADSWENDNPNHDEPGFHWENADENTIAATTDKLMLSVANGAIDAGAIRGVVADVVKLPFKAQIKLAGKGYRIVLDLT